MNNLPLALFNNIIVDVSHAKSAVDEKVSDGGIILREASKQPEIPTDGVIVSVGPDCKVLQVGMRICLPLNAGAMRYLDWKGKAKDEKYTVMSESSVPAVFEGE